jgi:hypothetical protein
MGENTAAYQFIRPHMSVNVIGKTAEEIMTPIRR